MLTNMVSSLHHQVMTVLLLFVLVEVVAMRIFLGGEKILEGKNDPRNSTTKVRTPKTNLEGENLAKL